MRYALLSILILTLSGCSIIYRLPTRQGNVIEQKKLDQLKLGMTRQQVVYLMGTPLAASPFNNNRWDYVGYYKSPRGKVSQRTVSLFFDGDKLDKMKGVQLAGNDKGVELPDTETLLEQAKKDKTDKSRAESEAGKSAGITVQPPR